MFNDKIKELVAKIKDLKSDLKEIKRDIKIEEKIDSPEFHDLNKAFKDLKRQVKDFTDQWLRELQEEEMYNKLREMKLKKDEEIAELKMELFEEINKSQEFKPAYFSADTTEGIIRIQIMPEMRLYLNGREEKKNN